MLNLFKWSKNTWQIVLEGSSFYFVSQIPIAFRAKKKFKKIVVPDTKFGEQCKTIIKILSSTGEIEYVPEKEFRSLMEKEYRKAIMTGAKRIAVNRMLPEKNNLEENKNDMVLHSRSALRSSGNN